jgi:hypothetical protein
MTALDALLDARVTDTEIALWLEISEQAVRMRRIERETQAIRYRHTLREEWKSHGSPLTNGAENLSESQSPSESKCANTYAESMP